MSVSRCSTRRQRPFLRRSHPGPIFCNMCKHYHADQIESCYVGDVSTLMAYRFVPVVTAESPEPGWAEVVVQVF